MTEQPLTGGMDAARGVVRVGDTVRRPSMAAPVRALLRHLEAVGFDGAPRHLGTDEQGRDVLSWVEGDVPVPPYPDWALTEAALESLGRLVRDYHAAVASFDSAGWTGWSAEWSDPGGGTVVCHNDLYPENVVFRDSLVVALIDFDMAAPGRPLWDLAIAAEEWAPLHAPGARLSTPDSLDAVRRIGVLARAYGLAPERADELLDVVAEEQAQSTRHVRAMAAAGDPVWAAHVSDSDFDARLDADARWLAELRPALVASIAARARTA